MQQTITVSVNGEDLVFDVTMSVYNSYINELQPTNKIAPANNFLTRTVQKDSREKLQTVLQKPSACVQIANAVVGEFTPDLEIVVKK